MNFVFHISRKEVLVIALSLQSGLLGLMGLEKIGLDIPIMRETIGFIYLFVPGFLFLKILKLGGNVTGTLLCTIGLSLSFLMFVGASISLVYPMVGISEPISEIPVITTISMIVVILCFVYYLCTRDHSEHLSLNLTLCPATLSLLTLPFLAILGAYFLHSYDNNSLLLILFALLSVIPVLTVYTETSCSMYPFILYILSFSLLLQNLFILPCNLGDMSFEYYISNLTLENGIWNTAFAINKNSLLALAILHPTISILCQMNLITEYMIVPSFLVSFIPLALYEIFRNEFSKRIAFLSSCFYVFIHPFFSILVRSTRTGIAVLFLSLLIFLIVEKQMGEKTRSILGVIFAFSLITSHYGVSYIFMFFLLMLSLARMSKPSFSYPFRILGSNTFIVLYVVLALGWYIYTTSSTTFTLLVGFGERVTTSLDELLRPEASSAMYVLQHQYDSISLKVTKYLLILATVFILIGFVSKLKGVFHSKLENDKSSRAYIIYSSLFMVILLCSFLPYTRFNISRIYPITLVLIAPFSAVGFQKVFSKNYWKIFGIFLMVLLICDTGILSATVTKDAVPFNPVIRPYIIEHGTQKEKYHLFRQYRSEYDLCSSKWLIERREKERVVYGSGSPSNILSNLVSTEYRETSISTAYVKFAIAEVPYLPVKEDTVENGQDLYIYIGEFSIRTGSIVLELRHKMGSDDEFVDISDFKLERINRVYDNGCSRIYET